MVTTTKKITITKDEQGQRLDIFLAEKLGISRSQAQNLITKKLVLVNDEPPKKTGVKIITGKVITFIKQKTTSQKPETEKTAGRAESSALLEPIIIAKTKDYVVLEKPAGLLVHPTQANEKISLVAWLKKKFPKIKTVGDDPAVRPGIVHRLDKEASGIMVVALNQPMFDLLKAQFKNRTITKEYLALVHGRVAREWEHLHFPIARGENNDRMAALPVTPYIPQGAKEAHTEYLVEKTFANCTLVRVFLHTGRMHQIRVHFLAYNHPLVGDPLYFQKKRKKNLDEKCRRLFLHSTKLSFTDLEGQKQTFESALPERLSLFLNILK